MIFAATGLDLRGTSSSLEITSNILNLLVEAVVAFGVEARDMALTFFGSAGRMLCVLIGFFTSCTGRASPSLGTSKTLLLPAAAEVVFGYEAREMTLAFLGSVMGTVCVLAGFFTVGSGRASLSLGTSNTLALLGEADARDL